MSRRTPNNQSKDNVDLAKRIDEVLAKIWVVIKGFWKVLIAIGIIFGIVTQWSSIKKLFNSDQQNFYNDNHLTGVIKSPYSSSQVPHSSNKYYVGEIPIDINVNGKPYSKIEGLYMPFFNSAAYIDIDLGGSFYRCKKADIEKGVNLIGPDFYTCSHALWLKEVNNRIYVNTELKDIENGGYIGKVDLNRWEIYNPSRATLQSDSNRLEIRDKQHYIALSINVSGPYSLNITGYFLNANCVFIAENPDFVGAKLLFKDNPADSGWKYEAEQYISSIKSVY